MMEWAEDLFPIYRCLMGFGVRQTLIYIQHELPMMRIFSVPSGTEVFGWTVPDEWIIREAYVTDSRGTKIIDFKENNLHIVGYSTPFSGWVSRNELLEHLHSAIGRIPYVTSYYKKTWGFCCTEETERGLDDDQYYVRIDSEFIKGNLNYGELIIPGQEMSEVLLSTYICHPSMANDNLSGIVVLMALAQWLQSEPRRYTYRIVFNPETIGSICYIKENDLSNVIAGYVINRVGAFGPLRLINSPNGRSLADRASHLVSKDYMHRASDERQYCSPLVNLPVCAITRGDFKEYHSSLDTLEIISEANLAGALAACQQIITTLEANRVYRRTAKCEPHLGPYYPAVGNMPATMMNVLAYADGRDLIDISHAIRAPFGECAQAAQQLYELGHLI